MDLYIIIGLSAIHALIKGYENSSRTDLLGTMEENESSSKKKVIILNIIKALIIFYFLRMLLGILGLLFISNA